MSRKTTAALIAALGINFALAGGALLLANLNKPVAYDADDSLADAYSDIKQVAGRSVNAEAGDLAVPLKAAQQGGNTRVTFTCGKKIPTGREVHEGTWDQVAGAVLYRPEDQALLAVEAVFDTRSLRTDTHALTQTVTANEKWFDIDKHPIATFTCDKINPSDAAAASYTHDLVGQFTLNGISKPLTIPAKLSFSGQSLTIDADFTILRSDYGVEKRDSSFAGTVGGVVSEVEDEVELSVRVTASPDPAAVVSELAQQLESQQEELRKVWKDIESYRALSVRLDMLQQELEAVASSGPAIQQQVDIDSLPARFTDVSEGFDKPYPFEMILVPGDPEEGIAAFYMSKHEVAWGMFDKWSQLGDLDHLTATEKSKLEKMNLRPSVLFGNPTITVQFNDKDNPAMAMSQITARAYCKWLTEKTGRKYRLPTLKEWRHAVNKGGGIPEQLDEFAWLESNSPLREDNDMPLTKPVASKKPNALGIHDLLGSVAEWVTDTGDERIVVGGSIFNLPEEISLDWKAVEDVEAWSATYPNYPKSRFWYKDYYFTGIRLVCETPSVAANPPKADAD